MSQPTQAHVNFVSESLLERSHSPTMSIHAPEITIPITRPLGVRKIILITQDRRATLQEIEELLKKTRLGMRDSDMPPRIEEIPDKLDLEDYFSSAVIARFERGGSLEGHSFFGWFLYFHSFGSAARAYEFFKSSDRIIGLSRLFFRITACDPSGPVVVAAQSTDDLPDFDTQASASSFTDWSWLLFPNFVLLNLMQFLGAIVCRVTSAIPYDVQQIFFCDVLPTIARYGERLSSLTWKLDISMDGDKPTDLQAASWMAKFDAQSFVKGAYAYVPTQPIVSISRFIKGTEALYVRFDEETRYFSPSFAKLDGFVFFPGFATMNLVQILEAVVCCATGGMTYDLELLFFCGILPEMARSGNKLFSTTLLALKRAQTFTLHLATDAYTSLQTLANRIFEPLSVFLNSGRKMIEAQKQEIRKLLYTQITLRLENIRATLDVLDLRDEIKRRDARFDALKNTIDTLDARFSELNEHYSTLHAEQERDWRAQITSLRSEIDQKFQDLQTTCFEEHRILKDNVTAQNAKLQSLQSLVCQMQEQVNAQGRLRDDRIRELESANLVLKADAETAKTYAASLNVELDEAQKLRQASDSAVNEYKRHNDALKRTAQQLQHRSDSALDDVKEMEESNAELVKECNRLQGRCEALRKQNVYHCVGLIVYLILLGGMVGFLFF